MVKRPFSLGLDVYCKKENIIIAAKKAIDACIAISACFAKPILNHLKKLVHKTYPAVEEK